MAHTVTLSEDGNLTQYMQYYNVPGTLYFRTTGYSNPSMFTFFFSLSFRDNLQKKLEEIKLQWNYIFVSETVNLKFLHIVTEKLIYGTFNLLNEPVITFLQINVMRLIKEIQCT